MKPPKGAAAGTVAAGIAAVALVIDDAARQSRSLLHPIKVALGVVDQAPPARPPSGSVRLSPHTGLVAEQMATEASVVRERARTESRRLASLIEPDCGQQVSPGRASGAALSALCKAAYDMRRGAVQDPTRYIVDELESFKNRNECLKDHYGTLTKSVATVVVAVFGSPPDDKQVRAFLAHACSQTPALF